MIISRPIAARRNMKKETTRLWFQDGSVMEAYVCGSVAWPMTLDEQNRAYGYAVLCCENVEDGVLYVYEETRFNCIDHIVTPEAALKHQGIADWFNMCWASYFCDTWFYHAKPDTHGQWCRMVLDSPMIDPKPGFAEVSWTDMYDVELRFYSRGTQGKFKAIANGELARAMNTHKAGRKEQPAAAVWAMLTAIAGYERWPWQDPRKRPPDVAPDPIRVNRADRWGGEIEQKGTENLI